MEVLNLFYEEPDPDRWVRFDNYPRRLFRRMIGRERPRGGQAIVFINLCAGLDRIGVQYRVNDYRYIERHPAEIACVIGKVQVLDKLKWGNPIVFGASVFAHPVDCPDVFERYPLRRLLVPGEWMKRMFERHYGSRIVQWPVGIDTDHWRPCGRAKEIDILLYDKKRWDRESFDSEFTDRIRTFLVKASISFNELRYGSYRPEDLENMVQTCKAAVFICESETQGLAYQQMLSAGLPLFVWDRQLHWYCPGYNVGEGESERATSVPYWDERCGMTFKDVHEFETGFAEFMSKVGSGSFAPRDYILEHLTLEKCARHYVEIIREVREEIGC